ncbi:restriction endonuclease [Psychrobacter sp. YP14]|nr:restriction endonuclease [Psychrobacter sp. YP14]
MAMDKIQINEVAKLLKYKHQVILQGPPGTGKTRLAKLVAEDLTHIEQKGKPQDILDNLVQSFDSSTDTVQSNRTKFKKLLTEFQNAFPVESLGSMTLDDFPIGNGKNDSFCWWIERGLEDLGKFSPGSSNNYPIYWSKDKEGYVINKKIGDNIDAETAMQVIARQLDKLVQETDLEASIALLGKSFTLKVLNSYYPDKYFPINSENSLNHALKLFGAYDRKMNLIEKNKKLYAIYHDKKEEFNKDITVNEFAGLIWNNFNLKDGERLSESDEVMTQGEYKVIQFHPAYTYEDFVRGVVAKTNEDGNIHYKVENKVLAQFAKKAYENPNSNYVLIIDEINRANLPSVLGELIYALEYRGETVESMYELLDKDDEDRQSHSSERNITLPKNLYIIGTMNTADRSIGHIDYAIRRRFAFYDVPPSVEVINFAKAKALFKQVQALFKTDSGGHLSSDFNASDVQLGHSYFLPSKKDMPEQEFYIELKNKLDYEIKPILFEYIKDGVLLDSARDVVEGLNV